MTNQALTIQALSELGALAAPPCLSLYQPTHRRHPENQQDPVRFRHGVEALAVSLRQRHGAGQTHALLTPFHELAADAGFWNHTLDGLAVLSCAGVFRVFVLPQGRCPSWRWWPTASTPSRCGVCCNRPVATRCWA